MPMQTSSHGVAVMHYYEQCALRAYPDPCSALGKALQARGLWRRVLAGAVAIPDALRGLSGAPWTIGYGDTGPDVVEGLVIDQPNADARFARRLVREFEPGVLDALQRNPKQCEFDAMVCLAYNIGMPGFRGSSVLRKFNLGDLPGAGEAFLMWNQSGGQPVLGLKRRRASERALFLGSGGDAAIAIGQAVMV